MLRHYLACFSTLHTAKRLGRPAPHKALLLLSVIDLVERGSISSPRIALTDELIATFNANSRTFYATSPLFKPNITYPFYHMQSEPFWRLIAAGEADASPAQAAELPAAPAAQAASPAGAYGARPSGAARRGLPAEKRPGWSPSSVKQLRQHYACAEIDPELFALLHDSDNRARLRVLLISTYLTGASLDLFAPLATLPLCLSLLATTVAG